MSPQRAGLRRSSTLIFLRRLILFRQLFRQDSSSELLLSVVNQQLNHDGYPDNQEIALKHDLNALKHEYNCKIRMNRKNGLYQLLDVGDFAILDLSQESRDALNFLESNYNDDSVLAAFVNIQNLLRQVKMLVPSHTNRNLPMPVLLRNPGRQVTTLDKRTLNTVRKAIDNQQQLEFDYVSNFEVDGSRKHVVAPYGIFFRDGHGYLEAVVLSTTPQGHVPPLATAEFRLDRILVRSAKMLPTSNPPVRPPQRIYRIVYHLPPEVARRRDLAEFFTNQQITYHADGSATVTGEVHNLWTTRQILLRYGGACRVSEPPELIQLFRETAMQLTAQYLDK